MSNLSQAERDKLPASAFCGPSRTYPIVDADDVASAARLIGMADDADRSAIRSCVIGKAKANNWALPDSWKTADHAGDACPTNLVGASFDSSDSSRADGEWVIRRGKIFQAGDYSDKSFSLSPEEMHLAVHAFTPVPLDMEHVSSVFDSKLGTLDKIEQSPNGYDLFGEVRLPKWLDEVLSADERKVSCTWDRATKRLVGLAIVRTPRVSDAALLSAFAGQRHSAGDQEAIQRIHDLARGQGAECPSNDESPEGNDDMATPTAEQATAEQTMLSKFFGWLTAGAPAAPAAAATFSAPPTPVQAAAPAAPANDPEKDQLRQQLAKLQAERINERAAAFADTQITASKAYPAQREAIISAYAAAAADDAQHGQATFAGGQGSRVDAFAAVFSAAPAHGLTTELMPVDASRMQQLPNPAQLLGTQKARFSDGTVDNAEVMRLLGTDPVGRTIVRDMALTAATAGGKAGK